MSMAGAAAAAVGAGQIVPGTRAYWEYSNDAYELRSVTAPGGAVTQYSRSILGPCPRAQVIEIARGGEMINPSAVGWQAAVTARLQAAHFETAGINTAPNNPHIGKTIAGYLKDPQSWRTIGTGFLKVGALVSAFLLPSFAARVAPQLAQNIGIGAIEEATAAGVIRHSAGFWARTANSGLIGGIVVGAAATGAGNVLYDALSKNIVPTDNFREWRRQQVLILTDRNNSPFNELMATNPGLYARIEADAFLGGEDNECPIRRQPIRYPVRAPDPTGHLPQGFLFEEGAIRGWLEQQRVQGVPLTNPLTNNPLALTDLVFDSALSDRIELRLLTLEAFDGA